MNDRRPTANALRQARDLYIGSRDLARNGASQARKFIHPSPALSPLLGLGLGALIGHGHRPRE